MKIFVWDENFVTGLERVDEQHHFLVDLINRFGESLIASKSMEDAELVSVFGQLANYAKYHFSAEESLMRECAVAPRHLDMHVRHHEDFLSQVTSMWSTRSTLSKPVEVLHGFLCAWLAFHVLGVDQDMARQIALIRAGKTSDEIFEIVQTPLESSVDGLLSALRNLYVVLTEQNQNLVWTNMNLSERVKELRCLHEVAALIASADKSELDILGETVHLLPSGLLYPEIACARIVFQGRQFATGNFMETPWKLGADILVGGLLAGTLEVYYLEQKPARDDGPFSQEERGLINTLADQLGALTERKAAEEKIKRYVADLEVAFMSTVEVATRLCELRDPYTAGHQRRVAEIALAIGAELGWDAHRQEGLRVAGHLHDVGQITIPAEVVGKPGKLSAIMYELVQGHTRAGYDVLKDVKFPWPVAQVALQHHERLDGSGYPQGLKGEAILIEARIVAVADVVEAMSSHRPYRRALGTDKALEEIERGRGSLYDTTVADACLRLFREKGYSIPE
ncbi:MAG: HD domain-containing protein [Ilumatobacteraceae bacterium]|jgi:hemerythrin-like metal-binding protein|nr:HD domain-containing protein [Ilumatobacteraceae bacterium]